MAEFGAVVEKQGPVTIVRVSGYYNDHGGQELRKVIEGILRGGISRIVIDFEKCTGINSPGVAVMIELGVLVTEDFRGRMVLSGLNELTNKVFALAGILTLATVASDVAEACRQAAA